MSKAKISMLKNVPIPSSFTINRNIRRFNMAEYDRKIFFSFNLFSLFLFTLPILYISKVNYNICEENKIIYDKLSNNGLKITKSIFLH
ncbi:conserved Plasmodium protein, unknown function [Plasmodium relictum]|uniref:Uncharacterized protein n=1 Tax=Plasmodium relictum TaxID=85471 RepID=A0A1J1HC96_PLARL|nr:conserved Plasmodium protein, unknown function [Plasmodium relictum]CRH02718.1 conserved Plasmodium protein, unknown function [Plasmodium relictum]